MKIRIFSQLLLGLFIATPALAQSGGHSGLSFSDARLIAPLVGTNVTAAYAVIKNESADPIQLAVAEAPPFRAVEMHETYETNGKTGMRKIAQITIPAHQVFELKPGGNHIMLFDPSRSVSAGEKLNIQFMADGKPLAVSFQVVTRGNPMEAHMHHDSHEACAYKLDAQSVAVSWTAFKTTKRLAVSGSFKKIKTTGPKSASNLESLVKGLKVEIDRRFVDSGNPARDKTLNDYFFKKLSAKPIVGSVKQISESDKSLTLSLSMNGHTQDIPMTFREEKGKFAAKGQISILDFQAKSALDSLHEKCADLHKGDDGISKTWPEVEITIGAIVDSQCK